MRSLTIASAFASLLLLASCASRTSSTPDARTHAARTVTWNDGPQLGRALSVDLRDCTMVLSRADRMPRSGRLDAAECASLAEAARPLPRTVPRGDCPVPKVMGSAFSVAYDDGSTIVGPRCTGSPPDGVPEDRALFDRIARVAEKHGPVLEASGATPPGECDPVDCRPKSTSASPYEFQDDGAYERCPDGRSIRNLEDRCLREPSGACALHRFEKTPCPP